MTEHLRTLAEIRATATKGVRGAGCDWGMAEEAGLATRVLESHGLPGVHVLARLLRRAPDCSTRKARSAQCGICAMAALSDRLPFPDDAIPEGPVAGPLLLAAPLILMAREQGVSYTLRWDGAVLRCTPGGVAAEGDVDCDVATGVTLDPAPGSPAEPVPPDWRSRPVAKGDWDVLEQFAAKTLVPETEASRAAGAGPSEVSVD
jgi:hypothetical protein